jgi:feruloyl-CoA synthase
VLAWPNIAECRNRCGDREGTIPVEDLLRLPELAEYLHTAFRRFNDQQEGSSTRINRFMFMTVPPSIDANEITDKGYINQRASLEQRRELVDLLYRDPPAPDVLLI